jgi:N-acetylglutamate synthase-like GNAT family acetyltransferase
MEEVLGEVEDGVDFWLYEEDGELQGAMGIQDVDDVTLIRHSYVRTERRNKGIGGKLLSELMLKAEQPVIIGTWSDAVWAVGFYEKHGFLRLSDAESTRLLDRYWNIPARQIETSVVLAEPRWFELQREGG